MTSDRKADHLQLTELAQTRALGPRHRGLTYEPLLACHPRDTRLEVDQKLGVAFLGKRLRAPLWISSMTGGTQAARTINRHLAQVAGEYGLGMGLGSCRPYLDNPKAARADFDFRAVIGEAGILLGNLGIAQVEQLLKRGEAERLNDMLQELKLDGLIVHINPLQEWFQPEGDRFERTPLATLQDLCEQVSFPLVVKEVGQGMGPKSLAALSRLPLAGIEFGAYGGTNFSKLEQLRRDCQEKSHLDELVTVGHDAWHMVEFFREIEQSRVERQALELVIVSGGVRTYLEGYELIQRLGRPAVYAYAKPFLDAAKNGPDQLRSFVEEEIKGLAMASAFMHLAEER